MINPIPPTDCLYPRFELKGVPYSGSEDHHAPMSQITLPFAGQNDATRFEYITCARRIRRAPLMHRDSKPLKRFERGGCRKGAGAAAGHG